MTKAVKNFAVDVVIISVLVFCFSLVAAHCQELPNAPSAIERECYRGADTDQGPPLHFMRRVPCDMLPKVGNIRDWTPVVVIPAKPGFFTFRKSPNDPPLRTNREVFHSKTFLLLNGAFAASVITDVEYTRGKRETRGSEYPIIPAIIGLDYVMDRFFTRAYSVEGPIYGIQHYVRDAFRGR